MSSLGIQGPKPPKLQHLHDDVTEIIYYLDKVNSQLTPLALFKDIHCRCHLRVPIQTPKPNQKGLDKAQVGQGGKSTMDKIGYA